MKTIQMIPELRKEAEKKLKPESMPIDNLSDEQVRKLAHELQVHQIELEMQNEELRKTQLLIEKSQQKYLDLFDFAPVGYFTISEQGLILEVNLTGAAILGIERNTLIKKPISKFIVSEDQDKYYLYRQSVYDGEETKMCELRMVKKNGIAFHVQLECSLAHDADESSRQYRLIITDITKRKLAEEQVTSLSKFPSENPNPVFRIRKDGIIIYANDSSQSLLKNWRIKVGEEIPDNLKQAIKSSYESQQTKKVEITSDFKIFSLFITSIIGTNYTNVYGIDITRHKQLERSLIQAEKFKAMGIMASGVAHEFNNILTVISNNAQLLKESNNGNIDLEEVLSVICRVVDDGAEIVDRMYRFTDINKDTSNYISIKMDDLIKQVIDFTRPRWKEMAHATGIIYHIDQNAPKTLPAVLGNPSEIREVLLNIVNNALDAMPNGGRVSFRARKNKNSVFIAISDTGNGMPKDVKEKMFDPFFTTRSPNGTGLGMSVSYGIVKRHGGTIDIESEKGKGSTIILSLPVFRKSIRQVVTP